MKTCPRCLKDKELTEENFYPARPRKGHNKAGWQSYCKTCWVDINKDQREKRKTPVGTFFPTLDEVPEVGGRIFEVVEGVLIERKTVLN